MHVVALPRFSRFPLSAPFCVTLFLRCSYVSPYIIDYAKKLTATLPEPLSVVFWVNSGSEANDLALRLARAHTKKRGVMCVSGAYHGHVISIIDISPYKYERSGGLGQRCVAYREGCMFAGNCA